MDAFEQVVSQILSTRGYWTQCSVKVNLTADDKRLLQSPTHPRGEIDIVAFSPQKNLLLAVECKSRLDSGGVSKDSLCDAEYIRAKHYKLFHNETLRRVMFGRLKEQFMAEGLCLPSTEVKLCFAGTNFRSEKDKDAIRTYFREKDWELFDDVWLREGLTSISEQSYDNRVLAVVAKILLAPKNKREQLAVDSL